MGATAQRRYGAANAYPRVIVEYADDPAAPVRGLMAQIAVRLQGKRGGTYPPGPGAPETSFTGYQTPAPTPGGIVGAAAPTLSGAGLVYPDQPANVMASGLPGPTANVAMAAFASRMRRRGAIQ